MEIVRELCSFEGRLAGTDAERRAANRMAERLRDTGRRAAIEPIHVQPQIGLVYAAHCALGFAGSLLAVEVVGFALVLLAATSMYLDLNARLYLVRRLFFRRASQNVVSNGGRSDAPARLVITAHLDAARTRGLLAEVDAPVRARRERHAVRAQPVAGPVLVAGVPGPGPRSARGRRRLRSALGAAAARHARAPRRRVRAHRHRALADRPRGERQRLGGRHSAVARGRAEGRAALEPRRLDRAHRRRGVPDAGHALVRSRTSRRAGPVLDVRPQPRLRRRRGRPLRGRRRPRSPTSSARASPSSAPRSRTPTPTARTRSAQPHCATASPPTPCRRASPVFPRPRSPASRPARRSRPTTTPPPTCPRRSSPRRWTAPTASRSS